MTQKENIPDNAMGQGNNVSIVSRYLEQIEGIRQGRDCIYRGEPESNTPLTSSAKRRILNALSKKEGEKTHVPNMIDYHKDMLEDARQKGHGYFDGRALSDLELLTELRHYSAAICLLDFSKRILVALYFACSNKNANSKLFILPHENIPPVPKDKEKDVEKLLSEGNTTYLWQPTIHGAAERRIIAQSGVFVINVDKNCEYIIIKHEHKEQILKELDEAHNINADELFMDLSGFAQSRSVTADFGKRWGHIYSGSAKTEPEQHGEAAKDSNGSIHVRPNDAEAYNNCGNAKSNLMQYKEAIDDYSKAISIRPDFAEAYYNRGNAKSSLRQYEEAIDDYSKAIHIIPNSANAYNNRGNARSSLRQYKEAIEDYSKAISIRPNYAEAYYNRGNTRSDLKQYREAIDDYGKAISIESNFAEAYYNRGTTKSRLRQYEEAINDYSKAIHIRSDFASAYYNRGIDRNSLKQYKEAIEDYSEAIRIRPKDANAYNNRGNIWFRLEQYKKAIDDYDEAIRIRPNHAETLHNAGVPGSG